MLNAPAPLPPPPPSPPSSPTANVLESYRTILKQMTFCIGIFEIRKLEIKKVDGYLVSKMTKL